MRDVGKRRQSTIAQAGMTLLELIIACSILLVLASAALPMARVTLRRQKETELRRDLREIRTAIDRYKDMADRANMTVTRLDVAESGGNTASLPFTFSANGDVYGVSSLLDMIRHSPRVMIVDKLRIQVNPALRGAPDVLQITLTMHAPALEQ